MITEFEGYKSLRVHAENEQMPIVQDAQCLPKRLCL